MEGSVKTVAAAVHEEVSSFVPGEAVTTSWKTFPTLDEAFQVASEFTNVPTVYLVLPTRSRWSVLWNNCFLFNGYDSLCGCITQNHGLTTIHWSAHDDRTSMQSGASFRHRQMVDGKVMERAVQVAQEDKHWHFFASGKSLPEEDLEAYESRRKQDRLNEEKMSEFLSRFEAFPWLDEFYEVPGTAAHVLKRKDPPSTVIRRSLADSFQKRRVW